MGLDLLRIGIQKDSDILKNPCFRKRKKKTTTITYSLAH